MINHYNDINDLTVNRIAVLKKSIWKYYEIK